VDISRRALLQAAAAAGALAALPDEDALAATAPAMPYTADSFYKSTTAGAPVDAARTTAFKSFMRTFPDQGGKGITWPKVNVNPAWATNFWLGKSSDPVWRLRGGNTGAARIHVLATQGFHMADAVADLFPYGTQDRPGVIVDPVFGYTAQFADAVPDKATRTIAVSNAGVMWHTSNGLDYRNPRSTDSRNQTSRGRIVDAMAIRPDVLTAAVANGTGLGHVLHCFFVETKSSDGFCNPMVGAESGQSGFGAEGERIAIRPGLDLTTRGLTGGALAVARTLQANGAYLGDNSGSATQLKGVVGGYPGTNVTTDCLKGKVAWDDFFVVERGWQ
jgi:hypothetical protein